jgi:hypothetical protein
MSAVVVIQMVLVVEFWHRLPMDSPFWKESGHAWCLSGLPSIASGEQEM